MNKKQKFSLMSLMNKASKEAAEPGAMPKYEQATLDISQIIPNPANKKIYSTKDIGRLAQSIELSGKVLQNLVVRDEDENGHYMLISGHRRLMACDMLVREGMEQYRKVNVLIEREPDSRIEELLLIESNASSRELTDGEKAAQAERTTELCRELKAEQKLPGRVRDIVAGLLDMSTSQLARYHAIVSNTTEPKLMERFNTGTMSTAAAYEAQKLDANQQAELAKKTEGKKKVTVEDVSKIAQKGAEPADVPKLDTFDTQDDEPDERQGEEGNKTDDGINWLEERNRYFEILHSVRQKIGKDARAEQELAKIDFDEGNEEEAKEHAMSSAIYLKFLNWTYAADDARGNLFKAVYNDQKRILSIIKNQQEEENQ